MVGVCAADILHQGQPADFAQRQCSSQRQLARAAEVGAVCAQRGRPSYRAKPCQRAILLPPAGSGIRFAGRDARPTSFRHEFRRRIRSLAVVVDEIAKHQTPALAPIFCCVHRYSSAHSPVYRIDAAPWPHLPERISLLSAAPTTNRHTSKSAVSPGCRRRTTSGRRPSPENCASQDCFIGDELWLRSTAPENWKARLSIQDDQEEITRCRTCYTWPMWWAPLTPRRYRDRCAPMWPCRRCS